MDSYACTELLRTISEGTKYQDILLRNTYVLDSKKTLNKPS